MLGQILSSFVSAVLFDLTFKARRLPVSCSIVRADDRRSDSRVMQKPGQGYVGWLFAHFFAELLPSIQLGAFFLALLQRVF
jgi:hypothetical protein